MLHNHANMASAATKDCGKGLTALQPYFTSNFSFKKCAAQDMQGS